MAADEAFITPEGIRRLSDGAGIREVKSAARTLELLELLAARRNEPMRLRAISDALNAPRSSVYALIRTLVDRGWVRTDPSGTLYSIGIRTLLAGTTYLDTDPLLRIVQPQILDLSVTLGETIHYGRLHGTDIVYLATHESTHYVRPFSRVGRRLPAFSTALGKILLAERLTSAGNADVLDRLPHPLPALTPKTVVELEALLDDLAVSRSRGYATDDEENLIGVWCIAVSLRLGSSPPTDAISASIPLERLSPARVPEILEALRRTKLLVERMAPMRS